MTAVLHAPLHGARPSVFLFSVCVCVCVCVFFNLPAPFKKKKKKMFKQQRVDIDALCHGGAVVTLSVGAATLAQSFVLGLFGFHVAFFVLATVSGFAFAISTMLVMLTFVIR